MSLDLDKFKTINDCNGHTVGNRLLQHVAADNFQRFFYVLLIDTNGNTSAINPCAWGSVSAGLFSIY